MAHLLDTTATGEAAFVSVGQTAWHRLGTVLAEAPSRAEAHRLAGHNYTVDLAPLIARLPVGEHGDTIDLPTEQYATVRTDRKQVLGIVGPRYVPIANLDAFGALDPLLDAGLARIECGGTLRGGRDAWLLVQFGGAQVREHLAPHGVAPYALVAANHAGERALVYQLTPVRVVCWNTLSAALAQGQQHTTWRVRHTVSGLSRVVEAAEAMTRAVLADAAATGAAFARLRRTYLDRVAFTRLVLDVVAPLPDKAQYQLANRYEAAMARQEARRNALATLWTQGTGHSGDGSAWEAYNAVAEALDHDAGHLFPSRDRLSSLRDGPLAAQKGRVLAGLLALAA